MPPESVCAARSGELESGIDASAGCEMKGFGKSGTEKRLLDELEELAVRWGVLGGWPGLWVGECRGPQSSVQRRERRARGGAKTGTAPGALDAWKMLEITERNGSLSVQNSHWRRLALLAQFGINFRPPLTSSSKVSSWSSQPTIRGPTHG